MDNSSRRLLRAGVGAGATFVATVAGLVIGLGVIAGALGIRNGALLAVVPLALAGLFAVLTFRIVNRPALWGITEEAQPAVSAAAADPQLYEAAVTALRAPLQAGANRAWFWLSLVAFVFVSRSGNWKTMVVIVPVLLFHELGHYAAMRVFGHDDAKIFFLPFIGAITTSKKHNGSPWQRAIILLAGPVPGIVLGALLLSAEGSLSHALGRLFIVVNGINLLPIVPLDGGRLVSTLLLSRSGKLEAAFAGTTTLIGVVYFAATQQIALAVAFGVTLVFLPLRSRAAQSAASLSGEYPAAVEDCQEPQLRQLYAGALHVLHRARKPRPTALASWMRDIHQRRVAVRPSGAIAAVLMLAYVGSAAVAGAIWVSSPTPTQRPEIEARAR